MSDRLAGLWIGAYKSISRVPIPDIQHQDALLPLSLVSGLCVLKMR